MADGLVSSPRDREAAAGVLAGLGARYKAEAAQVLRALLGEPASILPYGVPPPGTWRA